MNEITYRSCADGNLIHFTHSHQNINNFPIEIIGDNSGSSPMYLYCGDKDIFISTSVDKVLLEMQHRRFVKVSARGISYFLQFGLVPVPETIFDDFYILSVGDRMIVRIESDRFTAEYSHTFPYFVSASEGDSEPSTTTLLRHLCSATERADIGRDSGALFLSGGKDSTAIALALAEIGRDDVRCVTLANDTEDDESVIAAGVCATLGLKHDLFSGNLQTRELAMVLDRFYPFTHFPCADRVCLAYPSAHLQLGLQGGDIIDGSGNDIYFGHIPSQAEYRRQRLALLAPHLRSLSTSAAFAPLRRVARYKSEWCGLLSGFYFDEVKQFFDDAVDCKSRLEELDQIFRRKDYIQGRAAVRGVHVDQEKFMRKVRIWENAFNWRVKFPWCDNTLSQYCSNLPEASRFDRSQLSNKILLRQLLLEKLGYDAGRIGKRVFSFEPHLIYLLSQHKRLVQDTIVSCSVWNNGIATLIRAYFDAFEKNNNSKIYGIRIYEKIHTLFQFSAWHNHCRYLP